MTHSAFIEDNVFICSPFLAERPAFGLAERGWSEQGRAGKGEGGRDEGREGARCSRVAATSAAAPPSSESASQSPKRTSHLCFALRGKHV